MSERPQSKHPVGPLIPWSESLRSPALWRAVQAGLAAPTMLYARPQPYMAFAAPRTAAQSFAIVGVLITQALDGASGGAPPSAPRMAVER